MPTPIKFEDVTLDVDNNCCVTGDGAEALRDALIKKQANTIGELADKYSYVDPNDISINANGHVVIANSKFSELVEKARGTDGTVAFLDTNCSCGSHS